MRIVDLESLPTHVITQFDSRDAASVRLGHGHGDSHVHCIALQPHGEIGRHPTGFSQFFIALRGAGWVSGEDGAQHALRAGQVAVFERGEMHAKGAGAEGMLALMVQLTPDDQRRNTIA